MSIVRHTGKFSASAMFARYREICSVDGKQDEYVLFTRIGRGTKRFLVNNVFWGLLDSDTEFNTGDIVINSKNEKLYLVALAKNLQGVKGEFYKVNATIDIKRISQEYDEYDNPISSSATTVYKDYECVYEYVSTKMHLYDYGLLDSTVMRFLLSKDVDIQMLDRIVLNGKNYQVNNIDDFSFSPFRYCQCSEDTRDD